MRRIFSCFIVILIVAIAWVGSTTESDSSIIESQIVSLSSEVTAHYIDSFTPNFDLNLPRQFSGTSNILRANNAAKRSNIGHKNNIVFVKVGKVINVCCSNFILQESFKNRHLFVRSSSWLIRLGKLII